MQHLVNYDWLSDNRGVFAEIVGPDGKCGKLTVGEGDGIYIDNMPVRVGHVLVVYRNGTDKDPMNCKVE